MPPINITYTDPIYGPQHVVVEAPGGSGDTYYVYINNFYRGQIVQTKNGWESYINSQVLSQDDLDAISDAIALDVM